MVGVPVIVPVDEVMARPAGSPVADQVKVARRPGVGGAVGQRESRSRDVGLGARAASPVTGLVMVQVNVADAGEAGVVGGRQVTE